MKHTNTAARIDAADRANEHPDDCPPDAIATALEGRKLYDAQLLQKVDAVCRRCEEKNQKRRMAGVDLVDVHLDDGDRITLHAVHTVDDDAMRPPHWHIRGVSHVQHPRLDFAKCIEKGTALVRARATIHKSPSGELHIIDVDVENRSATDAGPDRSVVDRRQQEFVDDSDVHPDGMTVIDRDPEDAPAAWPELERSWLDDLIDEHGPLEESLYSASLGDDAGSLPGQR